MKLLQVNQVGIKIQDLINRVEQNRAELSSMDNIRVNEFIRKVADRRFLLSKAKKQLADEETRNNILVKMSIYIQN